MGKEKHVPNNHFFSSTLQARLRFLDTIGVAVFGVDRHGRFVYANRRAAEHFGYSLEELMAMNIGSLDCNYAVEPWAVHWEKVKRRQSLDVSTCHRHQSGRQLQVKLNINHMQVEDMELYCAFVLSSSDWDSTWTQVQECEDSFHQALDATSDGAWDINLQTGEVYYGAKWATTLGYSREDLQSGRITWHSLLHPDDREKAVEALHRHTRGQAPNYETEFRLKNSEGNYQWIHARGKIIEYDKNNAPLRFVGTHTDITSRKEMENSLIKSYEDTKIFAYSVVHDLKNPALAIRGLAERFSRKMAELPQDKRQMYCDKIIDSSEQVVELVEKINSYIAARETMKTFEEVQLKEVVRASHDEFAAQLQYRSIAWRAFPGNPVFRMDRLGIMRVLRNLIENSLKYGGAKLSKICIGYHETAGYHVISVRDDGVGMTVEDSERVFKPFERQKNAYGQKGSGLGLAIVKEIAKNHKGEVWIEPNRKRGITFCFAISKHL